MSDILSAICPLRVQKLSKKQRKRIFVYCSKMPYFRDFLHIPISHEKSAEIFIYRTADGSICGKESLCGRIYQIYRE